MRIAIDIDETLMPYNQEFPVERSLPSPLFRLWFCEQLRAGTTQLLRDLRRQGWDVWIYTTSGRTPVYFRTWFLLLGIRLGGVVNCHVHDKTLRQLGRSYPSCSKYPPAFGIDLLIDNCDGVEGEGKRYGFNVLRIDPADLNWTQRVRDTVQTLRR